MGYLKFKKMTDLDTRITLINATNNVVPVSIVTKEIAGIFQVSQYNIDLVQNCNIKSDTITLDTVVEVIVHPDERHLPFHLRTSEPDCMTGETDEFTSRLTCRHAITPDMLYSSCLSQLNDRKAFFKCPVQSCHAQIEFEEVIQKACLSDDEISFFEQRINKNALEKGKTCPDCTSFCERKDSNNPRVVCFYCSTKGKGTFEFCWDCGLNWKNGHVCPCQKKELQHTLQNCERITMGYNNMENVPKVRTCPKCSSMIEHVSGCKTMTCEYCKQIFCFCCLKLAVNRTLPCGDHTVGCYVAPIQIL